VQHIQSPHLVLESYERIKNYIHKTPIIQSESLNEMLGGHKIFFKAESLQKTGAFKVRGVLNHLLLMKEQNMLPERVVAYSTGNHGIGLAYVAKVLNIHARIYLPKHTSFVKQKAAEYYGAEVIYTESREEAERRSFLDQDNGFYYLHPSDSDSTIAGAGTMCFEALLEMKRKPDAIFVSCGGGGLASGTYLAKELMSKDSKLICTEPLNANDAFQSYHSGKIFRFKDSPNTIADGLKTLGLSARTFEYIKQMDDFVCVEEGEIFYWTAWLIHLLKIACEPSCALNMSAVKAWLAGKTEPQNVLVMISGGNIDPSLYREIWKEDYLMTSPISM
jgi:threonine dehydratase